MLWPSEQNLNNRVDVDVYYCVGLDHAANGADDYDVCINSALGSIYSWPTECVYLIYTLV